MLIIFLKAPIPGLVKTRLSAEFGDAKACSVYKELTEKSIDTAKKSQRNIILFYYPAHGKELITDWLGDTYEMRLQRGDGIGERMKNAFIDGFADGGDKIVLIGTDIPDLDVMTIDVAYEKLDTHDCVLGPSTDGGYYLIGFKQDRFRGEVFDNITWSTPSVLENTLIAAKKYKLKTALLGFKNDIDTPDDYRAFLMKN